MRKILCLHVSTELSDVLLEECARHSFLVEPLNDQELLLDLTAFKKIAGIIDSITRQISLEGEEAMIGLAGSPLLARLAAAPFMQLARKHPGCRCLFCQGIKVIQVLAGREKEFLNDMPVSEFFPLSSREQKQLRRMGYLSVGELADLSASRLRQMLKRDSMILWQNCQGVDYTPVRGLYPPDRITCARVFPEGCENDNQLAAICRDISRDLAEELASRQTACHYIRLEIITERGAELQERRVTEACHDALRLGNILQRLLPEIDAPAEEMRVVLEELERLKMQEMNLFTLRQEVQAEHRSGRRQELLDQLQEQYPDCLQLGYCLDRREQILALWDPWRISPGF